MSELHIAGRAHEIGQKSQNKLLIDSMSSPCMSVHVFIVSTMSFNINFIKAIMSVNTSCTINTRLCIPGTYFSMKNLWKVLALFHVHS